MRSERAPSSSSSSYSMTQASSSRARTRSVKSAGRLRKLPLTTCTLKSPTCRATASTGSRAGNFAACCTGGTLRGATAAVRSAPHPTSASAVQTRAPNRAVRMSSASHAARRTAKFRADARVTLAFRMASGASEDDGNRTLREDVVRAETALKASEERFRTVVHGAPDGVAILRGPTILYLNPRAARLLGLAHPEDGYGRRITDFIHPDDQAIAATRIRDLLQSGTPHEAPHEYRSRSRNGRDLVIEISSILIDFDGGPAVLAFARDVTERKAMQARLAQADRLAALGMLSAGVAHEINNPLAYVLLNLELM